MLLLLSLVHSTLAAEVAWDGHYRARSVFVDSLSLSDTNTSAEGLSWSADHRLRLQPGFLLSSQVSLFTQLDLLHGVTWGEQAVQLVDPVSGDETALAWSQAVEPPTTDEGGATLANIQVTRAWGELTLDWGQVRFGRMPVHWGTGMVWNAGDDPLSDYGDTADRIQAAGKVGDVLLLGAFETSSEGYIGERDDHSAVSAAVLHETEQVAIGTYHSYGWTRTEDSRFGAWTGDLWVAAELGPAQARGEFAAIVGSGDLSENVNDVSVSAFGANLDLIWNPGKMRLGLGAGLAGGDGDTDDKKIHTFTYDRDYNVALLLFEQPMPILEPTVSNDSNGGRTTDAVQTGSALSNVLYLRPQVGYQVRDDLTVDLSLFAAQQAKVADESADRKGYGTEFDLNIDYRPFPHFELQMTTALLFPGKFYSNYSHDSLGDGFDKAAFGGRLLGTVRF